MFEQQNEHTIRRSFSLRSVLLIALIVAFGAGLTVYSLASAFAAMTGTTSNSPSLQSTTSTTSSTVAHNCTRTTG